MCLHTVACGGGSQCAAFGSVQQKRGARLGYDVKVPLVGLQRVQGDVGQSLPPQGYDGGVGVDMVTHQQGYDLPFGLQLADLRADCVYPLGQMAISVEPTTDAECGLFSIQL